MTFRRQNLHPEGLSRRVVGGHLLYSPVVTLEDARLVFVSGLLARDAAGTIVGKGDMGAQIAQVGENLRVALEAAGATLADLVRAALHKATEYAKTRVVFDRAIDMNQAIQHPLAQNWAELEAANLMAFRAAQLYDRGDDCGAMANTAKYLAGEATFSACINAIMTYGSMGYAKEYHVERYLREALIHRIAPVTPHLALCYIAERVLGLPKSY